jgi:hypothetical protein
MLVPLVLLAGLASAVDNNAAGLVTELVTTAATST